MTDLSRRELLQAGAGVALAAYGLSGCTVERQVDRSAEGRIIKPEVDGDLLIYNWAQYMDPALKKEFAEKYGVEVNEVNFDNLEAMVIKLRSGAELRPDLAEHRVRLPAQRRGPAGALRPLRCCATTTTSRPSTTAPGGIPNNELSVPYTYYTTGIAWRTDEVSGMTGSWNDLLNPDGAGRMFILDDFQEAIGEANLINGFDLNTPVPERARDLEGDAARAEGERARLLHQQRPEPGLRAPRSCTRPGTATSSTSATRSTSPSSTSTRPARRGSRSAPT